MKRQLAATVIAFALCAALPFSVLANVSNVTYSTNGNVRVTGSGNPGEDYLVGIYSATGEVLAIGNASVDASGNFDVTIVAGIQRGSSSATYEVRAYSQDDPDVAPAAKDIKTLNVPRRPRSSDGDNSSDSDYDNSSESGNTSNNNTNDDNTDDNNEDDDNFSNNNTLNDNNDYSSDSVSFYDDYYAGDNVVYDNGTNVPTDSGEFIGANYKQDAPSEAPPERNGNSRAPRGNVSNFGRAPQTGVFDIALAASGMIICFLASAALWAYIFFKHRRAKNGRAQAS